MRRNISGVGYLYATNEVNMSEINKQWLGLPLNLLWGYLAIAVFMTGDGFELAVVQELADSNEVTINGRNRFDNNVKETSGKYGLGASVNVGKDVTLYGEANYRQGSHTETPVQGVAGIRFGF
jgi:hypothetical protein